MKKLFLILLSVLFVMFFVGPEIPFAQEPMQWSVESYDVTVQSSEETTVHQEYYLYYGNDATKATDEYYSRQQIMLALVFIHPVPEIEMEFEVPHRWYVYLFDSREGTSQLFALFDPEVYEYVPEEVKRIITALGVDDDKLILINYSLLTNSIRVLYHPNYCKNKSFYQLKLKKIQRKFIVPNKGKIA